MAVAIDTSVLVRKLTQDNPELAKQADQILSKARPGSLVLDRLIIEELGYVLRSLYGFTKPQVADVYRALLSEIVFAVPDHELVELAVSLFASERPLSFEDCWLVALKRAGKVTDIETFDGDLRKRLT